MLPLNQGDDNFNKMEKAFEMVMENEEIETVGDFYIRLTNESSIDNVEYLAYQINRINYVGPYDIINITDKVFMIKNSSAEKGGYGVSLLRSFNPQIPAIAFYFHVGKFGFLFVPSQKLSEGEVFIDQDNGKSFAYKIEEKYGIDMQGLVLTDNMLGYENINTKF